MTHQVDAPEMYGLQVCQPAFFKHTPRGGIFGVYQSCQLGKCEMAESKFERGANRLRRVSLSPKWFIQQVTDFRLVQFGKKLQSCPANDLIR